MSLTKIIFVYFFSKCEEIDGIVTPTRVQVNANSNLKSIMDELYNSNVIKTKNVWASLKQNGTQLNQFLTIRDMQSITNDTGGGDLNIFFYENQNEHDKQIRFSNIQKTPRRQLHESHQNKQVQLSPQKQYSIQAIKLLPAEQSQNGQPIETVQKPRKNSHKHDIKHHAKDQCCILM